MMEEPQHNYARTDETLQPTRDPRNTTRASVTPSLTFRAVLAGLVIGVSVSVSNIYFGLQIGFSSQMSMQSSLLGFAVFKVASKHLRLPFTPQENVLIQTVAGAVGCMPVTAGLIGVVPALEFLLAPAELGPLHFSYFQLLSWSIALCLFGLIWAMMLRRQFIVEEKLPWPGSVATATMISVLHANEKSSTDLHPMQAEFGSNDADRARSSLRAPASDSATSDNSSKIRVLLAAAVASGFFTLLTYFAPIFHNLPLFGSYLYRDWLWSVNASPGFVGSGIITGPAVSLHMLAGAVVGWAILSPIAKSKGWAPGNVEDWEHGSRGWIMWVSLAALLADCLIKLAWLVLGPMVRSFTVRSYIKDWLYRIRQRGSGFRYSRLSSNTVGDSYQEGSSEHPDHRCIDNSSNMVAPSSESREVAEESSVPEQGVGFRFLCLLLLISVLMCVMSVKYVFGDVIGVSTTIVAFVISLPLSIMGIRAVAETDWNPMSGIGKISQLAFGLIISKGNPHSVVINLIAGGLAEAGASQAGDIGHDLKIGYLLGARSEDQFYGQIIGSIFGSFIACVIYRLYTSIYEIPSKLFQIPVSHLFLLAARLVTGVGLPEQVANFACAFGLLFAIGTIVKIRYSSRWWQNLIPGGVAFGVGMYNTPSFTLARAMGGFLCWYYVSHLKKNREYMIVLAGGLVLGEGLMSMLNLGLAAANVPHLP